MMVVVMMILSPLGRIFRPYNSQNHQHSMGVQNEGQKWHLYAESGSRLFFAKNIHPKYDKKTYLTFIAICSRFAHISA